MSTALRKKNTVGRVIVAMFIPAITLAGVCVCVCMWHTQTRRGVQAQQSIAPLCFLSQNLSNDQSGIMIQSTQQDLWGVTITQTFHQGVQSMRWLAERIEDFWTPPTPTSHTCTWHQAGGNERWPAHSLHTVFFNSCRWPPISGYSGVTLF